MQAVRCAIAAPASGQARRQGGQRPFAAAQRPLQARPASSGRQAAAWQRRVAAEPEGAAPAPAAGASSSSTDAEETTFYEGSGAPAELALSLLLGIFVITLPLTIASVGRRLWIKYRFTNKRLIVTTNSPLLKREVQVSYEQIKEIRSAPRAFGLWGDVVVFLKDGSRLELAGLERFQEIVDYIDSQRR